MIPSWKIYPRSQGHSTVYLKNYEAVIFAGVTIGDGAVIGDPRCGHERCAAVYDRRRHSGKTDSPSV